MDTKCSLTLDTVRFLNMDARIACNPITSLYAVKPTDQERSSQQNENSQNITEIKTLVLRLSQLTQVRRQASHASFARRMVILGIVSAVPA